MVKGDGSGDRKADSLEVGKGKSLVIRVKDQSDQPGLVVRLDIHGTASKWWCLIRFDRPWNAVDISLW